MLVEYTVFIIPNVTRSIVSDGIADFQNHGNKVKEEIQSFSSMIHATKVPREEMPPHWKLRYTQA